jgi:hypothetical protein
MPPINQGKAKKGSQKWLQVLVNQHPKLINEHIARELKGDSAMDIEWLSPLERAHYAEYHDAGFINQLDITLKKPMADFWPPHGPVWDGLARTTQGQVFLVEAKSHPQYLILIGFTQELRPNFEFFLTCGIPGEMEGERYKPGLGDLILKIFFKLL